MLLNSISEEQLKFATWLFAQECLFVAGASNPAAVPDGTLPEVAFVGRSNVGKSSLINGLTTRSRLARVSHTPGRTKQLNFFSLGGQIMLVDLPGYGYAKAPKSEIANWTKLIKRYLKERPVLWRVFILVDSRHGLKPSDREVMSMLDVVAVNYQIVLTKTDKCSYEHLDEIKVAISAVMPEHQALHPVILSTSVRKGFGIQELRVIITQAMNSLH